MINLKTLPQASAQEVFDQVINHLRTQGVASKNMDNGCVYRNEEGLMCAAGCLIADNEYRTTLDYPESLDSSWGSLVREGSVPPDHFDLIISLQSIHDVTHPIYWEDQFLELADSENLIYTEIK